MVECVELLMHMTVAITTSSTSFGVDIKTVALNKLSQALASLCTLSHFSRDHKLIFQKALFDRGGNNVTRWRP